MNAEWPKNKLLWINTQKLALTNSKLMKESACNSLADEEKVKTIIWIINKYKDNIDDSNVSKSYITNENSKRELIDKATYISRTELT